MATKTRPATNGDGGTDYRIDAEERAYHEFSSSIWKRPPPDTNNPLGRNVVEVQAFVPSTSGGGRSRVPSRA